jgi:hypothetical protein
LLLCALAVLAVWLGVKIRDGEIPLPRWGLAIWVAGLALWCALSANLGPLSAYAVPGWHAQAAGLAVILLVSIMPECERARLDRGIRVAAWIMVLLALYQRFVFGVERPDGTLLNQNLLAAAVLLLAPLAYEQRDWPLCALLLFCLALTRSVGAWLALSISLLFVRRTRVLTWTAGLVAAVCLSLVASKVWRDPDFFNRWLWWSAAGRMAWERPILGYGPATFPYPMPAFLPVDRPLGTLFAHQYWLQTAAECGWLYMLAWCSGLILLSRQMSPGKRIGAVALLIHSCWDYALSVPGLYWLFCRFAGEGCPSEGALSLSGGRRWAAGSAVLAALIFAAAAIWRPWAAQGLRLRAQGLAQSGGEAAEATELLRRSQRLFPHPETARLAARINFALGDEREGIAELERAVALDPYRGSNWMMLEAAYQRFGRQDLAAAALSRGALTCPALRKP